VTLHILKLCVGVDALEDLADWQAARLSQMKGPRKLLSHVTRMTPKRRDEILDGGSLYWVIKGQIAARQPIVDLKPAVKHGHPSCAIVYEPVLIPVARRLCRAFQGWRYLKPEDAPPDLPAGMNGELGAELTKLGLL
jgi:hypothetical protein